MEVGGVLRNGRMLFKIKGRSPPPEVFLSMGFSAAAFAVF